MKTNKANTLDVSFPIRGGKASADSKVHGIDKWLTHKFLQVIGDPPLRVVLWDGNAVTNSDETTSVGMVIHDRLTLWRLLINPRLYFGDDYSTGRIDIEGGMVAFMETIYRAMAQSDKARFISNPRAYRKNQPGRNSLCVPTIEAEAIAKGGKALEGRHLMQLDNNPIPLVEIT